MFCVLRYDVDIFELEVLLPSITFKDITRVLRQIEAKWYISTKSHFWWNRPVTFVAFKFVIVNWRMLSFTSSIEPIVVVCECERFSLFFYIK